jgi:guanosine-3',5'-bis(diphosphate) 3'-pyrophosphohydrolase
MGDLAAVMRALDFAAQKHALQRRKGEAGEPYINHPIRVARYLSDVAGITDPAVLQAALLHDTLEDTDTSEAELREHFGDTVTELVLELTDDKSLPRRTRERIQVDEAASRSTDAANIKLADKLANITDIIEHPPADWTRERKLRYLEWSEEVTERLPNTESRLYELYRHRLAEGRERVESADRI